MRSRVLRHFARDTFVAEDKEDLPDLYYLASNRFTALLPLAKNPLFHGTGHSFLTDLGRQLEPCSFGPGDVLTRIGEEQRVTRDNIGRTAGDRRCTSWSRGVWSARTAEDGRRSSGRERSSGQTASSGFRRTPGPSTRRDIPRYGPPLAVPGPSL